MATRMARRAQRTRSGKKRPASGPSRRMYYVFLVVSVFVALTMVIPTCSPAPAP